MNPSEISRLSDDELLQAQIATMEEVQFGCWPLYEAMGTACQLCIEWMARQRSLEPESAMREIWEAREAAAHDVVKLVADCQRFIALGESDKAAHSAATAASIYISMGPQTILKSAQASRAKGGKSKRGTEGKLKRTLRALYETMDPCDLWHLMTELDADAHGRECALTELREQGRVFINPLEVTAGRMTYDEVGGKSGKTISAKRLNGILSELRSE